MREIYEKNQQNEKFDLYIDKINTLLDNIYIERAEVSFKIFDKLICLFNFIIYLF